MRTGKLEQWLSQPPRGCEETSAEFVLDSQDVARALGYARGSVDDISAHVSDVVATMEAEAQSLIRPRWLWKPFRGMFKGDCCIVNGSTPLVVGDQIMAQLKNATAVVVYVVTIGEALERTVQERMYGGDNVGGYVLDVIGSVAVESFADRLQELIAGEVSEFGLKTTNRFSPGYCSWPTSGQQELFSVLPEAPAGVDLNASSLMIPIKSVSGIIGVGANVVFQQYPCELCSLRGCHQRLA